MPKYTEIKTQHISDRAIRNYILDNCTKQTVEGFYTVKKPLKVWKRTSNKSLRKCIVALEIPIGATIYAEMMIGTETTSSHARKMRASEAKVVKQFSTGFNESDHIYNDIFRYKYRNYEEIQNTLSEYSRKFKYNTGETVSPTERFSYAQKICGTGVHFFVNLTDALDY